MTDTSHDAEADGRAIRLVGDDMEVPCVDGVSRRYLNLDAAASTNALRAVATRVHEFLPSYSSACKRLSGDIKRRYRSID